MMKVLRFAPLIAFTLQLGVGLYLVTDMLDLNLSTETCNARLNMTVTAPSCAAERGMLVELAPYTTAQPNRVKNMRTGMSLCFFSGTIVVFLAFILIMRWDVKSFRRMTPSTLLTYTTSSALPHYLQTILSILTFAIWLGFTLSGRDVSQWVTFINPNLSAEEYRTVLSWYSCTSTGFVVLILGDSLVQGMVCMSVVFTLLRPEGNTEMLFLTGLDIVQVICAVWALPFGFYVPQFRAYNLYMFSGVIRVARVVIGAPKLAHMRGFLFRHNLPLPVAVENISKASQETTTDITVRKNGMGEAMGEFALIIKLAFFLGGCSLLMTALEGWPCEHHVLEPHSPCECSQDLRHTIGSLYFVVTSMTTVGFGDVTPLTQVGRVSIVVIIAIGIFLVPKWILDMKWQLQHMRGKAPTRRRSSGSASTPQHRGVEFGGMQTLGNIGATSYTPTHSPASAPLPGPLQGRPMSTGDRASWRRSWQAASEAEDWSKLQETMTYQSRQITSQDQTIQMMLAAFVCPLVSEEVYEQFAFQSFGPTDMESSETQILEEIDQLRLPD